VGVGAATSLAAFDFDAGGDLRVRVAFVFRAASTASNDAFDVFAGATGVASLRPKPRAFAMVERRSE
jgi:hypothetical protein